ncbi:NYN domain-containing protein [Methanobacterium sp. YSL]|nr:NYN domain-containing protein [Methanobacterium sp. YSL]
MDYKIALLIDSENVSYKYIDFVVNEIAKYGKLVIARFYGDINAISKEWRQKAQDYAIKPMHQYNYATGKNGSDMEMSLDALEIKYQNRADTFFIVTSDSDFTPLAIKLKELGAIVIGVGDEHKTTKAFRSACSEFKYFQYLDQEEEGIPAEDIKTTIQNIIIENGENKVLLLSRLGDILVNQMSDFDPRKYGSSTLLQLVNKLGFTTYTKDTTSYVEFKTLTSLDLIEKHINEFLGKKKQAVIAQLRDSLVKAFPDFNSKNYGYSKLSLLLKSLGYTTDQHNYKRV